jgi:NADP-dependent 3-hydroxy acid dehydrogenase YdfG
MTQSKVIAITGASSGIGAEAAKLLAAQGNRLVLGARRLDRLQPVVDEINAAGGSALACEMDVSRREDVTRMVDTALEAFGRLDVFVNNAGIGPISLLDDLKVEDWEAMIDINFRGPLYSIAAALPVFRRQNRGQFVNVISTAGLVISPQMAVYAATKNAFRTLSEGLRKEAGPTIRVTDVSPGFVRTNFATSMTDAAVRADIEKSMDEFGLDPRAVARAITYVINEADDVDIGTLVIRPTAQS